MYRAMLSVPPVLSSVIPIMAPRIMRNPIDAIVLPKPSLIVAMILSAGNVVKARKNNKKCYESFKF